MNHKQNLLAALAFVVALSGIVHVVSENKQANFSSSSQSALVRQAILQESDVQVEKLSGGLIIADIPSRTPEGKEILRADYLFRTEDGQIFDIDRQTEERVDLGQWLGQEISLSVQPNRDTLSFSLEDVKLVSPDLSSRTQKTSSDFTGQKDVAVISFNFSDNTNVSASQSALRNRTFNNTGLSLNRYIQENSRGAMSLAGDVYGPYTLPGNNTQQCKTYDIDDKTAQLEAWQDQALGLAVQDGMSVQDYDYLIFTTPLTCSGVGWGFAIPWADPVRGHLDGGYGIRTLAHEFGHMILLDHSRSTSCFLDADQQYVCHLEEYGNRYSAMGGWNMNHYELTQKDWLGWLEPSEVHNVVFDRKTGHVGTFELLAQKSNMIDTRLIHILESYDRRLNSTQVNNISLEYYTPEPPFMEAYNEEGVLVKIGRYYTYDVGVSTRAPLLIDTNPGTSSADDAILQPGESYQSASGYVITFQQIVNGKAQVSVDYEPAVSIATRQNDYFSNSEEVEITVDIDDDQLYDSIDSFIILNVYQDGVLLKRSSAPINPSSMFIDGETKTLEISQYNLENYYGSQCSPDITACDFILDIAFTADQYSYGEIVGRKVIELQLNRLKKSEPKRFQPFQFFNSTSSSLQRN